MKNSLRTKDQTYTMSGNKVKAIIDVNLTRPEKSAPSIKDCRHAVITIKTKDGHGNDCYGYVTYDRLLCRIVNGVFADLESALLSAQHYNEEPDSPQDMAPNGNALGLFYPKASDER